jgi:hypothetical protein
MESIYCEETLSYIIVLMHLDHAAMFCYEPSIFSAGWSARHLCAALFTQGRRLCEGALAKARNPLSGEGVENRFKSELSKKCTV